jgi:uncharacterized protein
VAHCSDNAENLGMKPDRQIIEEALAHLDHVLPAQAPIQDFVHHNTLHGYQHLPFAEALAEAEKLTGIRGYLPEQEFRQFFHEGRIDENDLAWSLAKIPDGEKIFSFGDRVLSWRELWRIAMLHDLDSITVDQLNWQIEELGALDKVQDDVPEPLKKLYAGNPGPENPVMQLWEEICLQLALKPENRHPEQLLDSNRIKTESWLADLQDTEICHAQTRELALDALRQTLDGVGVDLTMREFVLALSGTDVLGEIQPQIAAWTASLLDEGVAAWQMPGRGEIGLYGAWRGFARHDIFPFLNELADFPHVMAELPEEALDCIQQQLAYFGLPPAKWQGYLTRLALEIPGWAGMVNWRQQRPGYTTANNPRVNLADFLAIRLVLDRLWLNQRCREIWKVAANLSALQGYFEKNLSEFIVRKQLYSGQLPEYLTHEAEALVLKAGSERQNRQDWQHLADLVSIWQESTSVNDTAIAANNTVWRIFRLTQHLGLVAADIRQTGRAGLLALLAAIDCFPPEQRRQVWLDAYERHYRDDFFRALCANVGRGRWQTRNVRPASQVVFCMDDREESFRRHLEELSPAVETMGAAGFFGLAMNYQGLDDVKSTALCPVVISPVHDIREQARTGAEPVFRRHLLGRNINLRMANLVHHGLRTNPLLSWFTVLGGAPLALFGLLGKVIFPSGQHGLMSGVSSLIAAKVPTGLHFIAQDESFNATPEQHRLGFTDSEQTDRIAGFLRNVGLTRGFAPLIVMMGHGSISQNNPHLAAYDCGACSGRHGGPNARLFAAIANRPEIRCQLAGRGIVIPDDTWFVGAEHNTCSEAIEWYDIGDLPPAKQAELAHLQEELAVAQKLSAHERCRRLASAPRDPEPDEALAHIQERAADFSQARPELGHATNAAAVVGRRSVTQGAFFDRRVFLISYDCTQDPDGSILEGILLAVGPVGAGINLEYYFSTVNNERFGCGTKIPHNVVGMFAVMEGTSSDLRTGLPRQMIEIHEAMRLQLLVEAKTAVLEKIYANQPSLRELIAGNWLHLSVMDPDEGVISVFETGKGFVVWQGENSGVPEFAGSPDCYRNQTAPVAPALIRQPSAGRG